MMRKTSWLLIPALGLGLALTVGTTWSFGFDDGPLGGGGHRAGRMQRMMRMMDDPGLREELGLSDEQATKLRGLRFDAAKAGIRARSDMMIQRLELEELLGADEPDRAAIDVKVRQLSDAHHALLKQHVEQRLAVHEILTPEQRSKMRSLRRQHRRRRGQERRPMHRPRVHPEGSPRGDGGLGGGDDFGPPFGPEASPSE